MKKIFTSILLASAAFAAQAQTTAPDFTATDCGGNSHTLYTELDADKVAIMVWVMPCPSCVGGANAAFDTWKDFEASNPGKVKFYLMDDMGDINCNDLKSWVNANVTTDNIALFDNNNEVIDEDDFGGTGMPHVVVAAGKDHKIYLNKRNAAANNPTAIKDAVQTALDVVLNVASINKEAGFTMTPNPVADIVTITSIKPVTKVIVTSMNGKVVREQSHPNGLNSITVDMASLPAGIYNVKIADAKGSSATQKIEKQ